MCYEFSECLLICVVSIWLDGGGSDHNSIKSLAVRVSCTCIFMLAFAFSAGIPKCPYPLFRNARTSAYQSISESWGTEMSLSLQTQLTAEPAHLTLRVDGGADGHICKPISQISSGIVRVAEHNILHPACCHLEHWKVTHLTCHIFCLHLTEPCIKQIHTRAVCLYWYQINLKVMFR